MILGKRKDETVTEMDGYIISADGNKMLYSSGQNFFISNSGEKTDTRKGMLNIGAIQVKIDPVAEWPQIFDEAWARKQGLFL
jgi:tricorn protease